MNAPALYEVEATFADHTVAERWVRWMLDEHITEVCRCGATMGRLIRIDGEKVRYVAQYEFASPGQLENYLQHHAPRLRAEGASRFPLELVSYSRRTGIILRPGG
ncbi:MAG: hypothetical protein DCC65_00230 [Planctomycetota bacterium]|nr:MAG: hypothetical protein DCC65_00230 [Planctomycetota bacterium]